MCTGWRSGRRGSSHRRFGMVPSIRSERATEITPLTGCLAARTIQQSAEPEVSGGRTSGRDDDRLVLPSGDSGGGRRGRRR